MSAHDAHGSTSDEMHSPHPAPGLPEVHDEAGDTPLWVPVVGAALLVLIGGWFVAEMATRSYDAPGAISDGGVADGDVADGAATDAGPAPAAR